jgi:hypothetical protein
MINLKFEARNSKKLQKEKKQNVKKLAYEYFILNFVLDLLITEG